MTLLVRIPFRTQARAGAIGLLRDYLIDAEISMNTYPSRPGKIAVLPVAFIELIDEELTDFVVGIQQRTPTVEIVVLHAKFDDIGAANAGDAFIDGFQAWVADNFHAFGANTLVTLTHIGDDPDYTANWLEGSPTYYATRITLEGFAAT